MSRLPAITWFVFVLTFLASTLPCCQWADACGLAQPPIDLHGVNLQKYGGSDPHGPDPHGDDPRDEQHDPNMPANRDQKEHKAPKDVYGGQYPNGQAPY